MPSPETEETLAQIYERHRTVGDVGHGDKGSIHSYIPVYEKLLAPYRHRGTWMEIGLAQGLSLAMWREYTPESVLFGVDKTIVFDRRPHEASGTRVIECDATSGALLPWLGTTRFDVVIDDASHDLQDQLATYRLLRGRMNTGSLYVIEDLLDPVRQMNEFRHLNPAVEWIDLRHVKGLFSDGLAVFRF